MIQRGGAGARRGLVAGTLALLVVPVACGGGSGRSDAGDGPGRNSDAGTRTDGSRRDTHLTADGFAVDGLPPCTAHGSYSASDSAAFFPYQVGARWRFQATGTTNVEPNFSPTTFLQERTVTGTRTIGSATTLVLQTSNTVENGAPVEEYRAITPDGLVDYGTSAARSVQDFESFAAPYTEVPFPVDGCTTLMTVDRTGIDSGQDIDGDGIDESVALYAVTVLRVEDVSVPIGTFPGSLRVETTTQATETESKTGRQFTSTETQVDWYAAGVGPIKRSWNSGTRTYDYELVAYSVGGVSRGVLPTGALARDLPQSTSNPYQPNRPTIGFDGSHFLVVVPTATSTPPFYQANLQPFVITPGAAPQTGSPLLPTSYAVTGIVTAFNGTEHMLAFNHNDARTVEVMPVGTNGTSLGNPVTVSNNMPVTAGIEETSFAPAIVNTPAGFLIGHLKTANVLSGTARQTNLWMVPVSPAGTPGTHVEPFPSTQQGPVCLATDGSTILAVWVQDGALLVAARFDATGHPIDATPLLVSRGQADSVSDVELVFDGTDFVALWKDNRGSTGGGSTQIARIGKGLTLLDGPTAGGISLGNANTSRTGQRIARLGNGSLVIWDGFSYAPAITGVVVTRFTKDGQVLDTQGLADGIVALGSVGGTPFAQRPLPEILWGGDRALLVWVYPPSASQSAAFGLDYGFAFPWDGGGSGTSGSGGGAGGAGGAGGTAGAGGVGGQSTTCGFTMPNPASTGLPNAVSYNTSVTGTVVDQVSGLDWERQPTVVAAAAGCTLDGSGLQLCPQAAAAAYCTANRLGGFSDWRLPTVLELYSLVDYTVSGTAIDQTTFPGTPATLFWSSTPGAQATARNWTVNFQLGNVQQTATQESHNVRCVRGTPQRCFPSRARYQVSADLATDATTGLVWQSYGGSSGLTWMAATSYCASLGMRLPSVKESLTILDFSQSPSTGYLVDRTAFTKLGSGFWWTSSIELGQYMSAWALDVEDGGLAGGNYYGGATESHCIR